jgi:hypothetical protein
MIKVVFFALMLLGCGWTLLAGDAVAELQLQVTREIGEQRIAGEVRRNWLAERSFLDNEIARLEEELRNRKQRVEAAESEARRLQAAVESASAELKKLAPDGVQSIRARIEALEQENSRSLKTELKFAAIADAAGVKRQFRVLRIGSVVEYALSPESGMCGIARPPEWKWEWRSDIAVMLKEAFRSCESGEGKIVRLPL